MRSGAGCRVSRASLPSAYVPGPLQSLHDRPGRVRSTCASCTVYTASTMVI